MLLDHDRFMLQEQVRLIRTVDAYDIFDPVTGQMIGHAVETPNTAITWLRLVITKNWMPTTVTVTDMNGQVVFTLHRGGFLFKSRIDVRDGEGNPIGHFMSRFWTLVGKLDVYDHHGNVWATVGGGRRWFFDYHFTTPDGTEIGHVSKQWRGALDIMKDLFTSADTFLVETNPEFASHAPAKMLILGAALAIDMVFKEQHGSDNIVSTLMDG